MEYTTEQLEKLPKWAKNKIKQLESINNYLQKELDVYKGKIETNTVIRNGLVKSFLPQNSVVEFKTGKNNMNNTTVYVRNDGFIDINTDSRLGETMVLLPRAANSFYITFIKD